MLHKEGRVPEQCHMVRFWIDDELRIRNVLRQDKGVHGRYQDVGVVVHHERWLHDSLLPGAVMPRKIEKQVVLDRALTVFWDHGYRGTSMDMLTERLGVEKPSIYASFGSKHKLYLSALGHYREWLIGSIRHIVSAAPSARAGVDQAVRMMMLRRSAKSRKGCFATNATLEVADHDPLVRQEVRKTFAELVEVFSHALKLAQSAGHVRTDCAPEILAQLLVNAIGGARIMEKTKASNSATEAVVALIIGILDAPALGAERTTLS